VNSIETGKSMILAKFGGRSALDDLLKYALLYASRVGRTQLEIAKYRVPSH
jgi:hypothetical protein